MTIGEIQSYWRNGLDLLVSGNEMDAQMSWAMGWSLAEETNCVEAIEEFVVLLTEKAAEQFKQKNYEVAWALRQYAGEAAPQDIDNLVESYHLALILEMPEEQEKTLAQLQTLLTSETIETVILELLDAFPERPFSPLIVPLLQIGIANQLLEASVIIAWILERRIVFSSYLKPRDRLALFQFCCAIDPQNSVFVLDVAIAYQDLHQTEDCFTWLNKFLSLDPSSFGNMTVSFMKTRSLLQSGGDWHAAEFHFHEYQFWIDRLITDRVSLDELNAKGIASTGFSVFYFADNPQKNLEFLQRLNRYSCEQTQSYYLPVVEELAKTYRSPTPKQKIRLGYISQSFYRHSISWIARWLLLYHDRQKFEIYVYSLVKQEDDLQHFFMNNTDRFTTLYKSLPTDDAAIKIHNDDIDILIDLDVQTCNHTLGILSLKPAPIVVSWLGSECSQHPQVDYYIADKNVLPEDAETYYRTPIWRLPHTYLAVDGFEIGVPRFTRSDFHIPVDAVIFWSSQSNQKRHPDLMKLQLQILQAVPNSYFMIKTPQEANIQDLFITMAQEVGVSPDRLRFLPRAPREEVHRADLQLADVVLDTYPYNGATTTLETLWLGIPLVTKVGQQFSARNSYMMLKSVGIEVGIAYTDREYVDWGIRLGTDANLRAQVHWQLLRSRQTSPLWNGKSFTKDMENAYAEMWQKYVHG